MIKEFDHLYKTVIIGNSGVGKSAILVRFVENQFSEHYLATIGVDFRFKSFPLEGNKIKLQIWDTAGQDKYKTITQSYYRNSHGVLVVFGLDARDTFLAIRTPLPTQAPGSRNSRRTWATTSPSCWSATRWTWKTRGKSPLTGPSASTRTTLISIVGRSLPRRATMSEKSSQNCWKVRHRSCRNI